MKNLFFFALILLFTSCATYEKSSLTGWNYNDPRPGGFEPAYGYDDYGRVVSESDGDELYVEKAVQRKVTYRASMELICKEPDSIPSQIQTLTKKYEGYLIRSGNSSITIKVKSEHLEAAMEEVSTMGKVRYSDMVGEDVTDRYFDLQIRLDNALKSRKRYLELLDKAQSVKEALLVEKELERLNGDIDRFKGQIASLDNNIAYSSLRITFFEKVKLGPLAYVGVGFYKGFKWLFVRN